MGFNRDIHHRLSIRLPTFDYSSHGAYFVTICSYQKECLFGEIAEGEMRLNEVGRIVQSVWDELPLRYPNIEIDEFVIMPNHVHGIVWIVDPVGVPLAGTLPAPGTLRSRVAPPACPAAPPADGPLFGRLTRAGTRPAPTELGNVIGGFKSMTTVEYIRQQRKTDPNDVMPKLWQRNYYERVIRSEPELHAVRQYIHDNPLKWELDPENQHGLTVPQ